ncbi:hypothetical protein ACIBF5_27395 [Micromonospora sp. NPDC050417]|uniref:hypothetical protein n=1 Tax=Micromonospora sp. NPDC050417 TaxID=3364280 RepID=UPI00379B5F29
MNRAPTTIAHARATPPLFGDDGTTDAVVVDHQWFVMDDVPADDSGIGRLVALASIQAEAILDPLRVDRTDTPSPSPSPPAEPDPT